MLELKEISLYGNNIKNIEAISLVIGLEELYLYNNYIENLEPLKNLINLKNIALENNCIADFSPIEYLKQNGKLTSVSGDSTEEQDYARCQ